MAGGGGTRLWPVSRNDNPKQFIDLGSGKSLLEQTFARATALTSLDHIYAATSERYAARVRELLPDLPPDHLFLEPHKRDTGPAFAAAAMALLERGEGNEPATFMWSDHVFTAEDVFMKDAAKIPRLVASHAKTVVVMGHRPTFPETGLGYIEMGEEIEPGVHTVRSFREKPNLATAKKYLEAGNYAWNMAYISLTPHYLVEQLREHAPELMTGIDIYEAARRRNDMTAAAAAYGELPKISIDYALLEKTPRILVVTGDYGWSDVGNWAAVGDVFGATGDHAPRGHHVHVDSHDNYVYNPTKMTVSLIGMSNSIVVVTDDAILITHKDYSHRVKDVVAQLEEEGNSDVL